MELIARPLVTDAFLPFGEVLEAPAEPGQSFFSSTLASLRAGASPNLRIVNRPPTPLPRPFSLLLGRASLTGQTHGITD